MEFVTDIELTDYKGSYVEKTDSAVETHDLVASLLKPQHTPQCSCRNPRNILKKTFSSSLPSLHESCPNAKSWATYINMPENGYELYATLIHISLETPGVDSSIKQITLDSSRTFPDTDYYSNGDGKTVLIRLLTAFSKYNQTIGYVQGMNFIAATLL